MKTKTYRDNIDHPFTDSILTKLNRTMDLGFRDFAKIYELCVNLERDRKILLSGCLSAMLAETPQGAERNLAETMRAIERGPLGLEERPCDCGLAAKLAGDGCATCNPDLAKEP